MDLAQISHDVMRERLGAFNQSLQGGIAGMALGGSTSGLWTNDPNRPRTWKDQEIYDAQQSANKPAAAVMGIQPATPPMPTAVAPEGTTFDKSGLGIIGRSNDGKEWDGNGNYTTPGLANAGVIPGKVNPAVADDITINAKKGEYILPQEVTDAIGVDTLDKLVLDIKKQLGLPQHIGPKRHDQPDSQGRMDKPGLPDVVGRSFGGINDLRGAGDGVTYEKVATAQDVVDKGGNPLSAAWQGVKNVLDPNVSDGLRKNVTPEAQQHQFEQQHITGMQENMASLPNAIGIPAQVNIPKMQASSASITPSIVAPSMVPSHTPQSTMPVNPVSAPQTSVPGELPAGVNEWDVSQGKQSRNDKWITGLNGKPYQVTGTNADGTKFDNGAVSGRWEKEEQAQRSDIRNSLAYDADIARAKEFNSPAAQIARLNAERNYFINKGGEYGKKGIAGIDAQVAALTTQQDLANKQLGIQTTADAQKYGADQVYKGHKITAEMGLEGHKYTADASVVKAKNAAVEKGNEQNQKDIKNRVDHYHKLFSNMDLSPSDRGRIQEYAANQAAVDSQPDKMFAMYGRAGRQGVALPALFKPLYEKALADARTKYPNESQAQEVAASHVYGIAQSKGVNGLPLLNASSIQNRPTKIEGE